jgi:hypothetical protein
VTTIPSVSTESVSSMVNLAWKMKCGTGAQFVAYGLTLFVLHGTAQKDILAICV